MRDDEEGGVDRRAELGLLLVERDLRAPELDLLAGALALADPDPDRVLAFELERDAGDDFEDARDADPDLDAPLPDFREPLPDLVLRAEPEPEPELALEPLRAVDFREEPDDDPPEAELPREAGLLDPELPRELEPRLDPELPFEADAPLVERVERRRRDAEASLLEDEERFLDVLRRDPPLSFSTAIVVLPRDRDGCLLAA